MTTSMQDSFVIHVELAQAKAWFERLHGRAAHLGGLMRDIGEILTKSTQGRFRDGVGPDGIPWQPLADGSGRTPLLDTGRMRDEIFPTSGEDWAQISATAKQAGWHQFGTDPYVILAKPGKALSWPGLPTRTNKAGKTIPGAVKKVNHPGLPARHYPALDARFDRDAVLGGLCFINAIKAEDGAIVHLGGYARMTFGERDVDECAAGESGTRLAQHRLHAARPQRRAAGGSRTHPGRPD